MNFRKYIAELKRRNVFKAGIAYLVVAWIVVQVASIILPAFNLPGFFMKFLVEFLLVGFPVWLVFSWIYDISSKGITRTSDEPDNSSDKVDVKTGQRLNKIIIGSLTIAVIILLYNQFQKSVIDDFHKDFNGRKLTDVIAVLPFSNNKPDSESDYLGFAMADQIIGDLSYLKNITVRPASSVRKYDKKVVDPLEVKEDLNVDYMLIGNYLKEGDVIRLNIELVELETNSMVWHSDQIEVKFSNTFQLQDIVAEKVVKGMNIQFSEKEIERIAKNISTDPLAYEYYLRSLAYPLTSEGDVLAREMLFKSIALDSLYAPSFAELGFREQRLTLFEMQDLGKVMVIEQYYKKALALNPELLSALGYLAILYAENSRVEEAIKITRKMLVINPNKASSHFSLGYIYRYIGMLEESVMEMEKALEIDPKNSNYARIGVSYMNLNEFDKAFKAFSFGKNTSYTLIWQAVTLFRKGDHKEALKLLDSVIDRNKEPYLVNHSIVLKSIIIKDFSKGLKVSRILEEANTTDSEGWYYLSVKYALLGDEESSIRCFRKAVDLGYYNYPFMNADPLLKSVKHRKDFQQILEKAKEKHLYFKRKYF